MKIIFVFPQLVLPGALATETFQLKPFKLRPNRCVSNWGHVCIEPKMILFMHNELWDVVLLVVDENIYGIIICWKLYRTHKYYTQEVHIWCTTLRLSASFTYHFTPRLLLLLLSPILSSPSRLSWVAKRMTGSLVGVHWLVGCLMMLSIHARHCFK